MPPLWYYIHQVLKIMGYTCLYSLSI